MVKVRPCTQAEVETEVGCSEMIEGIPNKVQLRQFTAKLQTESTGPNAQCSLVIVCCVDGGVGGR